MITITDENRAVWTHRLAEAESALHQLTIGKQTVRLSADGESLDFTPASMGKLRAYIAEIKAALGMQKRARPRARSVSFT